MNETGTIVFEGIGKELAQRLEKRGFTEFTPVQEEVLKLEDHKKDMIVRAKTGSGKTLAFLLPLYDEGRLEKGLARVLILSPTRELAQQTAQEARWLALGQDIQIATLVGGMDMSTQIRDLKKGASVIVGTPGRMLDHVKRGTLDTSEVHTVVLDEGDQMLDMGFREELEAILDSAGSRERTWLFSATMPPEMQKLLRKYLVEPRFLSLVEEGQQHSEIRHKVYQVPERKKIEGLINVLLWEKPEKGLIFCHTKAETADISRRLAEEGFAARCLHGDMSQRERNTTMSAFRNGHISLLVATNVAARGLDVPEIEKVFQFGLPDDMETFTHRSGRTGRAGEEGENVVILCPRDASRFRGMLRRTSIEAEWLKVPDGDEIKRKHRFEKQRGFFADTGTDPSEDIRGWARKLLEEESAEALVSRLLEEIDRTVPGGYELRNELEKDLSRKNTGKRDSGSSGPKRRNRVSRGSFTPVRLGLLPSKEWNVGRVLSGICNALDVSSKDVAKIDIQGDSVKVDLLPEALGKFNADSQSLQKWGFVKEGVSRQGNQRSFQKHGKREQRRTVKNRRDKQRTY